MQKVQGKGCFGLQDWRNLITFETRNEITKNIQLEDCQHDGIRL
jgi:hypothetical protein